ncbi:uncharacterized protein LOC130826797 isoform X2 [Amaranthus tricolor]|uniref:uncharacterized protein LOC130826797 isoform X2 n=1 Tax=Amaranthus tricolor TaxID=29722 RepID=UPI00258DAC99|nr:uncharacterized protein LOC130826797 isoform X2 [Amaranthus tricolor]
MGFDNDCILNIQSLAGEYFCPVCHLLVYPNEALQAQCTHLYCKPCLTYVVSTTHACPYDGYRVMESDCKPLSESNKALADTIGKIQVHCLYYRTGCTWQGALCDCISHCSSCSFGESPVLCNRCGIQIVHRQVQEHAQNCPGAQSQAQQSGTAQDNTSTGVGAGASANQSQTTTQTGTLVSQAQTTQTTAPAVSGQDSNHGGNSTVQPQAAQAAMPTAEQWQQYQQQYQQYYQQYPGYDPYQQQYQYYYQYQQGAQQYPQQAVQGYPPQAYGQAQPQVYGQTQTQPQLQTQQQVQPHAQPQPLTHPQPQPQPQASAQTALTAVNAPPQVQPSVHVQPKMQTQVQAPPSQALSYNQSQPLTQSQPYSQSQPVSQQQLQPPQYQQTHTQMQHLNAQPYPPSQAQTQTQHYPYPHPQSQVQAQPHLQQNLQASAHPPAQQNQPMNPSAQLQTQNAVTGYQSYPQPQPQPQMQVGAARPTQIPGAQPQYPVQMQGNFPQASQMYPAQAYPNITSQQPALSSAQVQPPSRPPAQQLPVQPHPQQPGYPVQQRPGVQATQQQYGQQQAFHGHVFAQPQPHPQPHPPMTAQAHAQGPPQLTQPPQQNYGLGYGVQPNATQSYAARPATQGTGNQTYAPAVGLTGLGQVRPSPVNQANSMRMNNQLLSEQQTGQSQQPLRATGGEKTHDQMLDSSIYDQNNPNKEARDLAGFKKDETKIKSESALDGGADGNNRTTPVTEPKVSENDIQDSKSRIKADGFEGVSKPSPGANSTKNGAQDLKDVGKKAEVQDLKHRTNTGASAAAPASNSGTNSFPSAGQGRNQLQVMQYGPSAHLGPGGASMPQSTLHPYNTQKPTAGHHLNQLRPQGPGQAPPRPPFNAPENSQPPLHEQPLGPLPQENASGAMSIPGSSASYARTGNMGYRQGNMPPYQGGQLQNPPGEPFVGPSFAAQRHGALDFHVGAKGREQADVERRPPFPMENETFPQRPGYFDARKPEPLPHGSTERAPYGSLHPGSQPGAVKFGDASPHDSMSAPGMRDGRVNRFHEEHLQHFPHRDFEHDSRKFPRPSHFEAGPSSKYGTQFPTSGALDHGPHVFDKGPHGFDRNSGLKKDSLAGSGPSRLFPPNLNHAIEKGQATSFPDDSRRRGDFGHHPEFPGSATGPVFGRSRMDSVPPGSPGREFPGFPSRSFGTYGDVGGNNFPNEPFGKSLHDNRFPVPPNHLLRGERDFAGNLRAGEHLASGPHNPDMLPLHLQRDHMGPRNLHMGDVKTFGSSGGHPRMGESPLAEKFHQHLPFGESFGGEKPGRPLMGELEFKGASGFQRYACEGGFYPEEREPFDNPRKWMAGSIMCRICKVECGTVEGLDLHSQSREHQRKARDIVLNIKQQNKKQKMLKDPASIQGRDGGRPKKAGFQGRGNKR